MRGEGIQHSLPAQELGPQIPLATQGLRGSYLEAWFRVWIQDQCWPTTSSWVPGTHMLYLPLSQGKRLSSPHPETLTPPRTAPLHPTASSHPLTGHSAGRKAAGSSCRPPPARAQCWASGCLSHSPWGALACCPHRSRRSVQAGTPCSGGPWPLSLEQSGWTWLAAPPGTVLRVGVPSQC